MRWEPRKVYLYLVSLVTFIMTLFGVWNLINAGIDIAYPPRAYNPCIETRAKDVPTPDPAQCEQIRQNQAAQMRANSVRSFIHSGAFLILVVPAYVYHWRLARRSEQP
ncbi:MAG TPA: hypothetical protein VGK74_25420 [Symbiobacteriaceae bacterium]|jgi:hypothetical protein